MKLGLARKAQAGAGPETFASGAGQSPDAGEAQPVGGVQRLVELVLAGVRRGEEVAVDPLEPAWNGFLLDDLFDPGDGGGVAGDRVPGALLPVHSFELGKPLVEDIAQVRGRAGGFLAADPVEVEDRDGAAFTRKQICRGEPGDPGSDHADVDGTVGGESRPV